MDQINALQIVLTILGSGALFSFLQFLIQRKDNKEDKEIDKKFEEIEKEIKEGLNEREKTGAERFEKHEKSITEIMEVHKKDLEKLLQTFDELKTNDERVERTINQIAENQKNVCDSLTGLAHDKIVYMTDKITERGYITLKERATLDSIYQPYKAMGGNSHAKAGYDHVIELDVISDDKAKEMDDLIKFNRHEDTVKKNK